MIPAQKAMSLFTPQSLRYAVMLDFGALKMGLYRKMRFKVNDRTAQAQSLHFHSVKCIALQSGQ